MMFPYREVGQRPPIYNPLSDPQAQIQYHSQKALDAAIVNPVNRSYYRVIISSFAMIPQGEHTGVSPLQTKTTRSIRTAAAVRYLLLANSMIMRSHLDAMADRTFISIHCERTGGYLTATDSAAAQLLNFRLVAGATAHQFYHRMKEPVSLFTITPGPAGTTNYGPGVVRFSKAGSVSLVIERENQLIIAEVSLVRLSPTPRRSIRWF
jgi:hypothetical protein